MSTAAIILAAGLSSRMGAPNKLAMEVGGKPLLLRVVDAVIPVVDRPPLVVLGHEADRLACLLRGRPVDIAVSLTYAQGQATTVTYGLNLAPLAEATLVALGDQPFLTSAALRRLLWAHRTSGAEGKATVPMSGERRGNPIVLSAPLRERVCQGGPNLGCRGLTRRYPDLVHPWPTTEQAFFTDIDTPRDLDTARAAYLPTADALLWSVFFAVTWPAFGARWPSNSLPRRPTCSRGSSFPAAERISPWT